MEDITNGVKVVRVLKKLKNIIKKNMGHCFKKLNLTGPQGMLVGTLAHHGEMKISDLSDMLGLSNSTVSGIIDRLENQGLVERVRSKEDRRVVYVNVTPKFRKESRENFEEINKIFDTMMDKATPEEMQAILKGLETLEKLIERQEE